MPEPLLQIRAATIRFGGVTALDRVDLSIGKGEICGLIGPNGAGKTTLFNSVTRLYDLSSGSIDFANTDLRAVHPRSVIGLGIARTFQNLGIYQDMTVLDNVLLGAHYRTKRRIFGTLVRPLASSREERELKQEAMEALSFFGLENTASALASSLPYGTLKKIEIARALMARPRLLLLDEPAAGLTHGEVDAFADLLRSLIHRFDLSMMLVEHHMGLVKAVCARVVALHLGRKIADGTAVEVQQDPMVIQAYLGGAA